MAELQRSIVIHQDLPFAPFLQKHGFEGRYVIHTVSRLNELARYLETNRPSLMILPATVLMGESSDGESFSRMNEIINTKHVPSLFYAANNHEAEAWNRLRLPQSQVLEAPWDDRTLLRLCNRTLGERLLIDSPMVCVVVDDKRFGYRWENYLLTHGFRYSLVSEADFEARMAKVKEPFADVFLWDMKLWEDDSKKMDPKWRSQSDAVFFLIKNDKDDEAHINPAEWMGLPVLPLSTAHENMTQIRTHLTRYRHDDLEKYRSTQTGIYLPRLFWKLADREMSMARQNGESFSILHATMKTPELLEKRFGQAYAQELKLHLALFIQNRIRTCDMVAQAPQGDVLLLLARATNEIAYKVSARINEQLRQSFVRQQTLTLDECPDIAFQIYTYPEHIKSMAELESIVQGVHAA